MKRKAFFIFVAVAVGAVLLYLFTEKPREADPSIRLSGNIETTEVDVGFKIAGRVVEITVQEGDWVEKGKVLARLDDEDLCQRVEVAQASLRSGTARLEKLLAGSRPEELREAEAALQQAQFDVENKQRHYERMKTLFERHVIPKETLDNAEVNYNIAKASVQRAMEGYQLVKEGPRKEDIRDAKAQVEQARASLKLAETQLGYTVLRSPLSGVVLVKPAEMGEVVNPGTPVLTLAEIENVWLKAYIPETDLGRVRWGQEVDVTTDTRPQKVYRGRISFISSQAEFTPKQIQTEKERVTLVYRIKIDIPNPNRELKPGMPADGKIVLMSSSSPSGKPDSNK